MKSLTTTKELDMYPKGCGKCARCYCQMLDIRDKMKKKGKTTQEITAKLKTKYKVVSLTNL